MERIKLEGTIRKDAGKGPSRQLRREHQIPAVVYGPRMDSVSLSLDQTDVKRVLASGENVLVDLEIKGAKKAQKRLVMVKDHQVHPVTDRLWHVDLYEVSLKEAIEVEVPLSFTGEAEGVIQGGILSPLIRALEISCLPEQIPDQIEVDCSSLNIGDTLHVSSLKVPPEIEVRTDPSTAVVTVSPPEVEVAPAEEVVEEEEAAEAAEAPSKEETEA